MRTYLLVGITVVAVALGANQVMSQNELDTQVRVQVENRTLLDKVHSLREDVSRVLQAHGDNLDGKLAKETALLTALDAYLEEDSLGKIINQLEDFVKQSSSSPRAQKAADAISILKGHGTSKPFLSPTPDVVRPRPNPQDPTF